MEDFLATVLPRLADTGAFGGSYPVIFIVPPKFWKILFLIYEKNKILSPLKM